MREKPAPARPDRASSRSRREVISDLTAVGLALIFGRSATADSPGAALCNIVMDTALGPLGMQLELGRAPLSAGDFLRYVDKGLYAGGAFYRTVRPDDDPKPVKIDVVQGGLTDEGKYLPSIEHEPTNVTGLRHRNGTLSIARGPVGTGSAGAFFICVGDQPELDFGGRRNADGQGFAAFGQVTSGMNLIRAIWSQKTRGSLGSSEGELIASPVAILGARRV